MGEKNYNFEDDQSVADLLGHLPRVEAPANFDARVRSRIAQGRPSSWRAWLIPSAAAVSLCSVVLAAVVFVYFRGRDAQVADAGQPDNPAVTSESPNPQFAESRNPEPANVSTQPTVSKTPALSLVAEKREGSISRPGPAASSKPGGGSYVETIKSSEAPRVPIGMPTPGTNPEANIRPPGSVNKVSSREVLQLIGLDGEFRDDGWHVRKVAENSSAARSGLRVGDVVEAIDDTKIIGNTTFDGGFNGKNLTVLRDGNRLTISLRNR